MADIPSYPPRRYLTAEERKAEILSVAIPVFVERGYAQAEMSEIAKHAGISRALLNRHFGNKDQLHRAALETSVAIEGDRIMSDPSISLKERVDHNTEVWLDHFETNPMVVGLALPVMAAGSRAGGSMADLGSVMVDRILANYLGTSDVPEIAKVATRASVTYCLMVCREWVEEEKITREQATRLVADHIFQVFSEEIPKLISGSES